MVRSAEPLADYVFRLADGSKHRVPIRERFEIADLAPFAQEPFLAALTSRMASGHAGPATGSAAGYRHRGDQGLGSRVLPMALGEPLPAVTIESLEIIPRGRRCLVVGVTLGLTDEAPFVRDGGVPVRIDLLDK